MKNKTKILIAEDEIDVRDSLVGVLEIENFEVFVAKDGKEGLEVFLEKSPDIVLSDIMMPEVNGYDFLSAIRKGKDYNHDVPFIFMSALGQKDDIIKGIDLEADDYLVKPIDFDILIAKIREKINGAKKNEVKAAKNIDNLKSQVSSIVPGEMMQYVDTINQISGLLRTEIYGPLPHRKYLEDINKIYVNSLKLKTMVSNFLSGSAISNQIDVVDEIVSPVEVVADFMTGLNKKFQSQIDISTGDVSGLANIKINKKVLTEVIKKLIGCLFKINEDLKIRITISSDHFDRVVFIFYPQSKIEKDFLAGQVEKCSMAQTLDSQGLELDMIANKDGTNVVLIVPSYRVIKKR